MPLDFHAVKNQFKQTWLTTLLSLILFAGVTYFLLWAESHTIQSTLMLEELVSSAGAIDVHTADDAERHEGRVVHVVGPLRILEPISEPDYNLQVQAVKLRKRVQMYQWIEEAREQDNFLSEPAEESQKTYWYHKDWRDYVVNSNLFYIRPGHQNPTSMRLFSETHIAENVKIGWLSLGIDVKRKVNDYYEIWSDTRPDPADIKLHAGFYYHGGSALRHEVGDLRVHFSYAGREDDIYTGVGVVENGVLQSYSPARFPAADPISVLRKGSFSLGQLHELEGRAVTLSTWKYRALGFVQVFASAMTLHPDWVTLFFLKCCCLLIVSSCLYFRSDKNNPNVTQRRGLRADAGYGHLKRKFDKYHLRAAPSKIYATHVSELRADGRRRSNSAAAWRREAELRADGRRRSNSAAAWRREAELRADDRRRSNSAAAWRREAELRADDRRRSNSAAAWRREAELRVDDRRRSNSAAAWRREAELQAERHVERGRREHDRHERIDRASARESGRSQLGATSVETSPSAPVTSSRSARQANVLQWQWISSGLRRCTRLWVNLVLSFSYTLLVTSIPWLVHKPSFGAIMLGGALLPILHYSTLLARRP